MSDLISREEAIDTLNIGAELLKRVLDDADIVGAERAKYEWGLGLIESYISDMEGLPSAEPVRHGKWIPISSNKKWIDVSKCSICGKQYSLYPLDYDYCPNCGADMRGESE